MIIIHREVQHIYPDKWADLAVIDQEYNKIEAKYGFPQKKRSQLLSGKDEMNTLIIEYQFESLAAMEAAFEKLMADPEWQALGERANSILRDIRIELLMPLP